MSHIQFKWASWHFGLCSGHWVNVWFSLRQNGLLFENNTFFLLFFTSSHKLSILHGRSVSLEAICWILVHKIFKPEDFCKMIKHVHRHFGTMQSYLRNHCHFKSLLNLIWKKSFLDPTHFTCGDVTSNSKQVALEEYCCLKGLQILT